MNRTTGILVLAITMTAGGALATQAAAQNTDAIDNARSIAKSLQQKQDVESSAALDAAGTPSPSQPSSASTSAKPAPGAPAPAVRPAVIPGAQSASSAPKPAAPVAKAAPASSPVSSSASAHNQLQKVNVVQSANSIQIEISASGAVTPKVEKLKSPDRIAIMLPETSDASAQNKISVGAAGVKGVRIGMDGKNPPTTSIVVDLDKALAYELTPSAAGKTILTLHAQGTVQQAAAQPAAKPATQALAVQTATKNSPAPATAKVSSMPMAQTKPAPQPAVTQAKASVPAKVVVAKADPMAAKTGAAKAESMKVVASSPAPVAASKPDTKTTANASKTPAAEPASTTDDSKIAKADDKKADKPEDKKWAMSGKRDPFFSPVVQQSGSGCSTGKKCLEIGNINLRGVVKSDNGFIAVVTNNLNKAYFLRENDPVFNGYVVKITGDSVTFQETVQDKLGKTSTREVVKRLFTPAV
jgi:Tfp pilus assembly protein PilP